MQQQYTVKIKHPYHESVGSIPDDFYDKYGTLDSAKRYARSMAILNPGCIVYLIQADTGGVKMRAEYNESKY